MVELSIRPARATSGQSVRVVFHWWIPEAASGPGQFQLDDVHVEGASLQRFLDLTAPGDTAFVPPLTWSGPGNVDLDFGGKDVVLLATAGPDSTVIDTMSSQGMPVMGGSGSCATSVNGRCSFSIDFDIPAAHRNHRWNLAEADQHEDKIALIDDPGKQGLLQWAYAGFHAVRPRLAALPHQVIHGDAHDENVLVEGDRVCGLIDFGDCCYNPTVNDLAICLTYLMMRRDDPLEVADLVIAGYQAVRALTDEELDLLYPLICARLAVSVCIANKRKTIDPDNPNWFGGENAAWRLLAWLRRAGPDVFTARTKAGL